MADPSTYRPKTGEIPTEPGVYRFRDEHGRVIYVGKAKNLRARLTSYFQDPARLHPRTATMVTTAASLDWTLVNSELEALQLEWTWIKEFDPRFNVMFRDDKSYPWLAISMGEEFPRVMVVRGDRKKGTRYFGPYAQAWAIRDTIDILLRVFPMRSCSTGVFKRAERSGRPCLLGYIDKCSAPCVGRVSPDEHREIATDFAEFIAGRTSGFMRTLEKQMQAASEELDFERAARLRDDLAALRNAMEKQAVVLTDASDCDVIAFADDPLEVAVDIFYVRGGRIRGQRGWVADRADDDDFSSVVETFLSQMYLDDDGVEAPKEILVPVLPEDHAELEELLSERRGSRVEIRVPQRGEKKVLIETVAKNAAEVLRRHKTQRASDLTTRSRALEEIADALDLPSAPLRIECYDISHLQGTNVVGSMVVFEDGLARKGEYRRFVIKGFEGSNDVAAIDEVISRRFSRLREEEAEIAAAPRDVETGRPKGFSYRPGLVVVDGGAPQVAAASAAMSRLGLGDIPVVGLAKRLEEVWVPGEEDPVIMPRTSEGLYLLQRVRDESHRFAITHQRARRKSVLTSALDEIAGLGPAKRAALLQHFGSAKAVASASLDELSEVPGIGPTMAETIRASLQPQARVPETSGEEG